MSLIGSFQECCFISWGSTIRLKNYFRTYTEFYQPVYKKHRNDFKKLYYLLRTIEMIPNTYNICLGPTRTCREGLSIEWLRLLITLWAIAFWLTYFNNYLVPIRTPRETLCIWCSVLCLIFYGGLLPIGSVKLKKFDWKKSRSIFDTTLWFDIYFPSALRIFFPLCERHFIINDMNQLTVNYPRLTKPTRSLILSKRIITAHLLTHEKT